MLGPLEVRVDGEPVGISGPLPRCLLALLTARAGQDVSVDQLIEDLWTEPSDAARATLHSHIARLRRSLGQADLVVHRTGRYRLDIDPEEVDANAFTRAIEEGRRAAESSDFGNVVNAIGRGLDLWRGKAYEEFEDCPTLAGESRRFELLRLDGLEMYFAAQLKCNSPLPPIAQLESLIQDHPTRERLWALLMKAQYRSSRQADALTTYQRARRFLVDELGVEPGPELQELEIRVLQQDPSLLAEPRSDLPGLIRAQAGAKERRTVTVVRVANPTQSSADPEDFARSEAELERSIDQVVGHFGGVLLPGVHPSTVVFGAPRAHEDDPLRAIAASGVLASEKGASSMAFGVSTGEVLADSAGTHPQGRPLIRSAELAALATAGQILADTETGQRLAGWASVAWAGPDTFVVEAGPFAEMPPSQSTGTRLVGRQYELSVLRAAYARSRVGPGPTLVTIIGEAGVGKSRLAAESRLRLRQEVDSLNWLVGRCVPYGDQSGLRPLGEIIRLGLASDDLDSSADVEARAASVIARSENAVLNTLAPLFSGDSRVGGSRSESFAAWARLLDLFAREAPTVVIFEDLQWAAPLVLDFLEYLLTSPRQEPLLVIATARPELLEQRSRWTRIPGSLLVRLDALSPGDTTELVDELLGTGGPTSAERGRLALRSAGIPLFVEELVGSPRKTIPLLITSQRGCPLSSPLGSTPCQSICGRCSERPPSSRVRSGRISCRTCCPRIRSRQNGHCSTLPLAASSALSRT